MVNTFSENSEVRSLQTSDSSKLIRVPFSKKSRYVGLAAYSFNALGEKKIANATRANPKEPMIPTGKGPSSVFG